MVVNALKTHAFTRANVSYDVPFSPVSSPPTTAVLDLTDSVSSLSEKDAIKSK